MAMPRLSKIMIALSLTVLLSRCGDKTELRPIKIKVDSLSQIQLLNDSLVKPIIYTGVTGLEKQPVDLAKKMFLAVILPAVLIAKHHVWQEREKLLIIKAKRRWNNKDSTYYHDLKLQYKASDIENLLKRMMTLPNSIVLAQAAMESGWGQSRFFREGNNVFGIWSYNRNEPRLKASVKRPNAVVHVRAYKDISHSVYDYFKTLGKANAYRELRTALQETNDPLVLLPHLKYYSEKRLGYVNRLKILIEQNNLTQYDNYRIDPSYFASP